MKKRLRFSLLVVATACPLLAAHAAEISVSGRHTLWIDGQTTVIVEGEEVPAGQLVLRPGMKVTAELGHGRGVAEPIVTLVFSFDLRGVVTGIDPVEVLGQPLVITADTELGGYQSASDIEVGDAVVVSGQFDVNGSLAASLIEQLEAPPGSWRLGGYVSELGPGAEQLSIGGQLLDHAGVTPEGCDGPLATGDFVTARADHIPGFTAGDPIDTVTDIACADPVPPGTPGAGGGLEGVVGEIIDDASFSLGGLTIQHDSGTVFVQGNADDLEPGALIELEGTFSDATTVLAAEIEFVRPILRVRAPIEPGDVTVGEAIAALGLTFRAGPQLRDEDGIIANGLTAATQVEVRGWIDSDGQIFANRVRERGDPEPAQLTLRGPVSNIQQPLFDILALTVDTSASAFADELGNPITEQQFFDLLEIDAIAEIDAAQLDAGGTTLSGGTVTLIDVVVPQRVDAIHGDFATLIFGTVTEGTGVRVLFSDRFEASPR